MEDSNNQSGLATVEASIKSAEKVAAAARDILDEHTDDPKEQNRMVILTIQRLSGDMADHFGDRTIGLAISATDSVDVTLPRRIANAMLAAAGKEAPQSDKEAKLLVLMRAVGILLQVPITSISNSILKRDF